MNQEQVLATDRLKSLVEFYGPDSLKHLVGIFKTEAPKRLGLIQEALNSGDMKVLRFHLHQMKSSSANLGSHSLATYLQGLERSADAGTVEPQSVMNELTQKMDAFISEIEKYLSSQSPTTETTNSQAI